MPKNTINKISEMFYKKCPWCDEGFRNIGEPLVGTDTAGPGSPILWLHAKCGEEWRKSDMNFRWDGNKFTKISDRDMAKEREN